jgi:DNA-binding beta-propeller fold protein YncE/ABC-type branched-subunit amino acid transport system substrate-binding protein
MSVGTDARVGTELLDYRLEELVGRGGMGVVYRAADPRLKRDVALKLLAPEYAADDRFRERFLTETERAASLEHPNVIPIHDAGEVDGQLYLVMRLADGGDLKKVLAAERTLEPRRALEICEQVAAALDGAHEAGLVHRDVKPSNVLLDRRGHVYLADFGLSRTLSEQAPGFEAGLSLGTPAYVAPEQIEGKEIDGRADQYSLACLLHECLTGRPPFPRGSEAAVLFAHLEEPPPAPPGIGGVMRRALDKLPSQRYATCREFVAEARAALGVEEARASRWPFALAAVLLAIAMAGLLAYMLTREAPSSGPATTGRLVRIDPAANEVAETVAVGDDANAVAVAPTGVWVANRGDGTVWRIDPQTNVVSLKTSAHGKPTDLAVTDTRTFVVNGPQEANITVIDGATGREENVIGPGGGFFQGSGAVAAEDDDVWVGGADRRVSRLDVVTGRLENPLFLAPPGDEGSDAYFSSIAAADGGVWAIGDPLDRTLWRIDPDNGELAATIRLPFAPKDVAVGEGAVWVSSQLDDSVTRIDPVSGSITRRTSVGAGASGVAVGLGSIWVASSIEGTISRIDPATAEVTDTIAVDGSPVDIAIGEDAVWVAANVVTRPGDDEEIRVGLVTVCEGAYGLTSEPSVAGAELPLLHRGATLAGARSIDGIEGATVAGKTVGLYLGCGDQTGETALAETRRLVEQAGVDILIGPNYIGEGLAIKDYVRSRPDVTFVATSPAQALTLHDAAPNLFRFVTDGAQLMAGLGAYAYRELGWRRAVTIADDQSFDYTQVAGFVAEFCALGGTVEQVWVPGTQQTSPSYYAGLPHDVDGYVAAGFILNVLGFVNAVPRLRGNLAEEVVGGILSSNLEGIGTQADRFVGVVYGMSVPGITGPRTAEQRAWEAYVREYVATFPAYEGLATSVFPIAHTNSMEAVLRALETVEGDLSDDQTRFQAALARTELDAPNGPIRLDGTRQAVAPNYLQQVTKTNAGLTMRTEQTLARVEQTFNGYFDSAAPLGRDTIECRKTNPPAWARR